MLAEVALPIKLTFRLWLRFWPQLIAVVLLGLTVSDLLMWVAVKAAYINHYAGLGLLALVALTQLVTTVSMIQIVRPGLPSVNGTDAQADEQADRSANSALCRLTTIIAVGACFRSLPTTQPGVSSGRTRLRPIFAPRT